MSLRGKDEAPKESKEARANSEMGLIELEISVRGSHFGFRGFRQRERDEAQRKSARLSPRLPQGDESERLRE